jgi:hypothetical protein
MTPAHRERKGFRVSGFGFRVQGLGFSVQVGSADTPIAPAQRESAKGLGFRVQGLGFRV